MPRKPVLLGAQRRFTVILSEQDAASLARLAKANHTTESEIVRRLIAKAGRDASTEVSP